MWLAVTSLIIVVFVVTCVPWWISVGVGVVYYLWYTDGKEYTGERRWDAFRALRVWKTLTPIEHVFPHKTDLTQTMTSRRVFVFIPCATPSPLIWGIGLHGGCAQFSGITHYMVPPPYMWIPFVRDFFLWSGAVSYSPFNARHSRRQVMLDLLNQGRSICYSPSNFATDSDLESGAVETKYPSLEMLNWMREEKMQLIPVIVQGEYDRYVIPQHRWLRRIQDWCYQRTDYAFPMCYWFRLYNPTRPPQLKVQFGSIMTCENYPSGDVLLQSLKDHVSRCTMTGLGDREIKTQN